MSALTSQELMQKHTIAEKCGVDDAIHEVTSTIFYTVSCYSRQGQGRVYV